MMVEVSIKLYSLRCQLFYLSWNASIFHKQPPVLQILFHLASEYFYSSRLCFLPTKIVSANGGCLTLNSAMFALFSSKNEGMSIT